MESVQFQCLRDKMIEVVKHMAAVIAMGNSSRSARL